MSTNTNASDAYFVWEKYEIDVPAFSNINDYKDKYVLKLYVNGKESNDFYVEYETNCSSFSTVSTHKVGKYTVYYKAYSKANYLSSEQGIIFNVIDVTAPEIILDSDVIELEYGLTLDDLVWYRVTDDLCSSKELEVVLNDSSVIYTIPGTYNATLTVTDIYGNKTIKKISVKILNSLKPTIKVIDKLNFEYGIKPDLKEYFLCLDTYNNDITKYLEISGLDVNKLGKQEVILSVSDLSNNKTTMTIEVYVVDTKSPLLDLICGEVILDIVEFNTYDVLYFEQFVYRLVDNYSKNISLDIDISELCLEVKDFNVIYIASDENKNETKKVLKVMLRETCGPIITVQESLKLEIGEEIDLYSLVTVTDPYDSEVLSRLIIEDDGLDINTPGVYQVKYICFNTSGIYSEKVLEITVGDGVFLEEESNYNYEYEIIGLLVVICVLTGVIILIFYKVKKAKNKY